MQLLSLLSLASAATALTVPARRDLEIKHVLTAADGTKFSLKENVINSAAYKPFQNSDTVMFDGHRAQRRTSDRPENPPANRNATVPDYVFTLMCDQDGFRGNCLVFGAKPGECGTSCVHGRRGSPKSGTRTASPSPFHRRCLLTRCLSSVSFRDFDPSGSTSISDMYDNKVVSLSTNTGGNCQFY